MANQSNDRSSVVVGVVVIVAILLGSFLIYILFGNLGDLGYLILIPLMIFTIALLVVNFRSLARRVGADPAQLESEFEDLRQVSGDHISGWHADSVEFQALKALATPVPVLQAAVTQLTSVSLPSLAARLTDLESRPVADQVLAGLPDAFEAFKTAVTADLQDIQSRPQFDPQALATLEARVNQLIVQVIDEAAKMTQLRKGLESIEAQMAANAAQMAVFDQRIGDFEAAVTALQATNTRPSRQKKGG